MPSVGWNNKYLAKHSMNRNVQHWIKRACSNLTLFDLRGDPKDPQLSKSLNALIEVAPEMCVDFLYISIKKRFYQNLFVISRIYMRVLTTFLKFLNKFFIEQIHQKLVSLENTFLPAKWSVFNFLLLLY